MNTVLWILQGLLAFVFVASGGMKVVRTKAQLKAMPQMGWADDFSEPQIKAIGLVEVIGAVGLVLPWALGILPILTPIAAAGLAVIMGGAAATHLRRKEPAVPPMVLAVLAAGVAIGRFVL